MVFNYPRRMRNIWHLGYFQNYSWNTSIVVLKYCVTAENNMWSESSLYFIMEENKVEAIQTYDLTPVKLSCNNLKCITRSWQVKLDWTSMMKNPIVIFADVLCITLRKNRNRKESVALIDMMACSKGKREMVFSATCKRMPIWRIVGGGKA